MRVSCVVLVVFCLVVAASARHRLFKSAAPIQGSKCEDDAKGVCQEDSKTCDGKYLSGMCPGAANVRCCAPKSYSPPTGGDDPTQNTDKTVCLTFDDGPFDITKEISKSLADLKVKATFFDNCHSGTATTLAQVIKDGHVIADHMCSHDIMTVGGYGKFYGATKDGPDCLTTSEQQKLFKENVMGVINAYENDAAYKSAYDAAGVSAPQISLIRFPGDGRFMQCLISKLSTMERKLVHVGWTYEIAPKGTFGHVIESSGIDGLSATRPVPPSNRATILAHDLHYKGGKLPLLINWVKMLLDKGYKFSLLNSEGKCA